MKELVRSPRILRAVAVQVAALGLLALLLSRLATEPENNKVEQRAPKPKPVPSEKPAIEVKVLRLPPAQHAPKPPAPKASEPPPAQPPSPLEPPPPRTTSPKAASAPLEPPKAPAHAKPTPALPKVAEDAATPSPAKVTPAPAPPPRPPRATRIIAAEQSQLEGVPLRVLVPSSVSDLQRHLDATGGCMAVSQLRGDHAEVLDVYRIASGRAVVVGGEPCPGIPRIVRSEELNSSLGDPIGKTRERLRARGYQEDVTLVLQLLLSSSLSGYAHQSLQRAFGPAPEGELMRRAAAAGHAVRCVALTSGAFTCD